MDTSSAIFLSEEARKTIRQECWEASFDQFREKLNNWKPPIRNGSEVVMSNPYKLQGCYGEYGMAPNPRTEECGVCVVCCDSFKDVQKNERLILDIDNRCLKGLCSH